MAATNHVEIFIPTDSSDEINYSERAQWLRAAILGANDGLVSVASLMMGVGAIKDDVKTMILTGFLGLFAGACSMCIGEFVSVSSHRDIRRAEINRERMRSSADEENDDGESLPNPFQAAMASGFAFALGAVVPLLAATFITNYELRVKVVLGATTLALVALGVVGAVLGRTKVAKSCCRVVMGGWMAMGITVGLTKLIGSGGLEL